MALKAIHSLSCPNCLAALEHEGAGLMTCPYCGSQFVDENVAAAASKGRPRGHRTPRTLERILTDVIGQIGDDDAYGCVVTLEGQSDPKHAKARANFDIPHDAVIYLVWDETMFGSCKEGYAITDRGLYYRYSEYGTRFMDWRGVADAAIDEVSDYYLNINGDELTMTGGNGRNMTSRMLRRIKRALIEELGYVGAEEVDWY